MPRPTIPCLAAALLAGTAFAPPGAGQGTTSVDDASRRRLVGALTATYLSVDLDNVPARTAIESLAAALDVNMVGRYNDDRAGHGIDPDQPVTFRIDDAPALLVLEMILDQCAIDEPCTWQIRTGFIEVGTKERLGARAACETRVYDLTDLTLEAPYFQGPSILSLLGNRSLFPDYRNRDPDPVMFDDLAERHSHGTAALKRRLLNPGERENPEELAAEIVRGIVSQIEPGNWDYGQLDNAANAGQGDPDEDEDDGARPGRRQSRSRDPRAAGKIARIRILRRQLIINAPDFIHRQIDGYPPPILPSRPTDTQRHERSAAASSAEGCTITRLEVVDPLAPAAPQPPRPSATP